MPYSPDYYQKNKEKFNEYSRTYFSKNKEKCLAYHTKWRHENSDKVREQNRVYNHTKRKNFGSSSRFIVYRLSAKYRNLSFELDLNEFNNLLKNECVYCGDKEKIGIDREDNKLGYTSSNSVSCCITCNRAKLCMSKEEYIGHCKKVVLFSKGK